MGNNENGYLSCFGDGVDASDASAVTEEKLGYACMILLSTCRRLLLLG